METKNADILISDKTDFKVKNYKKRQGHYMTVKRISLTRGSNS
jgi:hypothetical protein